MNDSVSPRTAIVLTYVLAVVSGCMFRGVRKDIETVGRLGSVRGTVARDGAGRGDILVVAYTPGASEAADVFTLGAPGKYLFVLPPGSYRITAFEESLMGNPLPRGLRYNLFFGFGGGNDSLLLQGANDGVVSVATELDPRAQRAAIKIFGYDETHMGIRNNAAVAAHLNAVLETP